MKIQIPDKAFSVEGLPGLIATILSIPVLLFAIVSILWLVVLTVACLVPAFVVALIWGKTERNDVCDVSFEWYSLKRYLTTMKESWLNKHKAE